ncbi:MAG TPA: hypothetical protein VII95_17720 [Terriglobales bacterium]|jgi:hypothetical protein
MSIPLRGLRTIRTLAGKVALVAVPHRALLQVACLELEKARRTTERTSTLRRLAELDARLMEIDAEQTGLLQALADRKGKTVEAGIGRHSRGHTQPFKIRY